MIRKTKEELRQEAVGALWNADFPEDQFTQTLVQQYTICVQSADEVSARRASSNAFFLSLHTLLIGALGLGGSELDFGTKDGMPVAVTGAAGVILCVIWFLVLKHYRGLNAAKFEVIGLMEQKLPSMPLIGAEWKMLASGDDLRVHMPLTWIEQWVPAVFLLLYVILGMLLLC